MRITTTCSWAAPCWSWRRATAPPPAAASGRRWHTATRKKRFRWPPAALQLRNREDLTRASLAVLLAAQRLNPLNTDHTANLARLYRSWAFSNVTTAESGNNATLRQLALTRPQEVDVTKLQQSIRHYQAALSLSGHNSGLWNELAVVQFVANDVQGALASLDRSQQLDDRFYQTYVLRGEILGDGGDKAGALEAYRQANELRPNDPNVVSAIGVYSAQSGDMAGAIQAFDQLIDGGKRALAVVQRDLAEFDQAATRAGSVAALGAGAQGRRDQLQSGGERTEVAVAPGVPQQGHRAARRRVAGRCDGGGAAGACARIG